ncbi:MAG: F0F1 ATP synthase subunit epsilon [Anaerolineales bacterium]|nr:F0F1 ATP synthase subunit epsilon [Anaerolineales bacterium]
MTIRCEIVTQERIVYSEDVDSVNLPGIEGRMGILPNHSPLLTVLDFGEVITRKAGREEFFAIGGGFAEVQPEKVIVLADSAEHADEIDIQRAEQARAQALQAMEEGVELDMETYALIERSLHRANIRLDVSRRRSKMPRRRQLPDLSGESSE